MVANQIRQAPLQAGWPPWTLLAMLVATALLFPLTLPITARAAEPDLSVYAYEDTKSLIRLVDAAAALVERKGEAAFSEFQVPQSHWWSHQEAYIFVYAVDGTCVVHPDRPSLVGQNQIDQQDSDGRYIVRDIVSVTQRPEPDASRWVFYLGKDRTSFSPAWKVNYVRKVIAPDHKVYALGSGFFNPKTERMFVQQDVDDAVALLLKDGKAGMPRLREGQFEMIDSYVFVLDAHGKLLFDPVFPNREPEDLWDFTDATGAHTIQEVLQRLATADAVWVPYLVPPPGGKTPSRKLMYVRKVTIDGETLYVGSDFFVSIPIWMRVENDGTWQRDPPT